MGLALDELDEKAYVEDGNIKIMVDAPVQRYLEFGSPITVDYRQSVHGSGFYIDKGFSC